MERVKLDLCGLREVLDIVLLRTEEQIVLTVYHSIFFDKYGHTFHDNIDVNFVYCPFLCCFICSFCNVFKNLLNKCIYFGHEFHSETLKPCFLYVTGNVGRFKNRGKSHSERARTPGRQTPRRASPVDDEGSFDSSSDRSPAEEARSSQHNSHSADRDGHHYSLDGTLVETLASEVTVRTGRKSKSDSSERRSKAKSSKTSSQASSVADEEQVLEQLPQVPVIDKKFSAVNSRSPSPKLGVRKSKSPELSQRTSRGEGDDPSFANTLDDIATMGTNEVADQDLSSHYIDDRPRSADLLVEPHEDVPVVNYIRPITPEEEVADEPKTIAVKPTPIRQVEAQKIEVKDEPEVVAVQDTGQVEKKTTPEQLYEPSYEIVEQPVEIEAPVMVEVKPTINVRDTNQQEQGDHQMAVTEAPVEELRAETEQEEVNAENVQEVKVKQESPIDIRKEVARSTSPGSSLGFNSSPPDRQYTPLSFSSSDAQFYSPPDSPDISLSEQLQDKPQTGQTQVNPARLSSLFTVDPTHLSHYIVNLHT